MYILANFKNTDEVSQQHHGEYTPASDLNDCATKCNYEGSSCDNFSYCPGEKLCRIHRNPVYAGDAILPHGPCELYKRKLVEFEILF